MLSEACPERAVQFWHMQEANRNATFPLSTYGCRLLPLHMIATNNFKVKGNWCCAIILG